MENDLESTHHPSSVDLPRPKSLPNPGDPGRTAGDRAEDPAGDEGAGGDVAMKWPKACLGDVAQVVSGATPKSSVDHYWDGDIPWITPADLSRLEEKEFSVTARLITEAGLSSCSSRILPPRSVLFSSRAPIGHVAINTVPMATNQGFKSFVPDHEILSSDFLYWWLKSNKAYLQSLGRGATFKEVSKEIVESIEIPLPPLEEQRRIAAILDKAHEIQVADRKRRETLGRFQASYFRYLFGEPGKTTESWSLKAITSCCKSIQTGPFGSLLHQSDYIQGGIPIVNPKHIINGVVSCGENETITEDKAEELSSYRLEEGDVLLARRGEMGRCAAITRIENGYLCGTGSIFLRLLRDALAPEYLAALLSSKHMRRKLERVAIGTTLLNLNSTIVGDVLIPVPPIELQLRYARFLARLDAIGDITSRSAFACSAVLASIQNSIFPIAGS
jgi:type I restriction enzyme S subunit